MLHITNGDVVADGLRRSGLGGDVSVSADVLHEGPCLSTLPAAEYRETRARFLAAAGYATYEQAIDRLIQSDAALESARDTEEVVLWFEHDLFDQLLLIRLLAWFASQGARVRPPTLICIGQYPGIARFDGLGQLSPPQLAGLFPTRTIVTDVQLRLGADAWARFGESTPLRFAALLDEDTSALPFLSGAISRQLEDLPSVQSGLSRSEHQALTAIASGAADLAAAFRSTQSMEERVFCGDLTFFRMVHGLVSAARPLVHVDAPDGRIAPAREHVSLTTVGHDVLAGSVDHAAINGIDRWIGGTHVEGRRPAWRWDHVRRTIEGQP